MSLFKSSTFLALCLVVMMSCQDSPEFVKGKESFFQAKFFNIGRLNEIIELNTLIIEEQKIVSDSIILVNDSIDDGNSSYEPLLPPLLERTEPLDTANNFYDSIIARINSGLILMGEIRAENSIEPLLFEESMSVYSIPLPQNRNEVQYHFTVDNKVRSVGFTFLQELTNDNNVLKMDAFLPVVMSDYSLLNFDSISPPLCLDTLCNTNDATISFYF